MSKYPSRFRAKVSRRGRMRSGGGFTTRFRLTASLGWYGAIRPAVRNSCARRSNSGFTNAPATINWPRKSTGRFRFRDPALDCVDHFGGAFGRRFAIGAAFDIRRERRLIRIVDAGHSMKFAGAGSPVQAFDIALLAHFEWSVNVHFQK